MDTKQFDTQQFDTQQFDINEMFQLFISISTSTSAPSDSVAFAKRVFCSAILTSKVPLM
jgi:hypothetical protein